MIQCLYYSPPFREHILNFPQRTSHAVVRHAIEVSAEKSKTIAASPSKVKGPQSVNIAAQASAKEDAKDSAEHKKKMALVNGPVLNLDYSNCDKYGMEETLFTSLKDMFEAIAIYESRTGVVSPQKFLDILRRDYDIFRTPMHQDAHEFLNILLNQVVENVDQYTRQTEEEKNSASGGSNTESPLDSETSSTDQKPNSRWLHELFEGTLTSETRCMTCEHSSFRDEAFLDLSVDLDVFSSVTSCLARFSDEEMLCERNKFHCDRCGGLQEAEKRMRLKNLPKVLALHLKRFKYTEDLQRLQKLFHHVSYPNFLRLFNTTNSSTGSLKIYELYGIVVHIGGGAYHGHYVSIVKTQDHGWLLFDDEMVEPVDPSFVYEFFGGEQSLACAYVLFYHESEEPAMYEEQAVQAVQAVPAVPAIDRKPADSEATIAPNLQVVTSSLPPEQESFPYANRHVTAPQSATATIPPHHTHYQSKLDHVVSSPNLTSLHKQETELNQKPAKERTKAADQEARGVEYSDHASKFSISSSFQRFKASSKSLKVRSKSSFFNASSSSRYSPSNTTVSTSSSSTNRLSGSFNNHSSNFSKGVTTNSHDNHAEPHPSSPPTQQHDLQPPQFVLSETLALASGPPENKPLPSLPPVERRRDKRSMWGLNRRKADDSNDVSF